MGKWRRVPKRTSVALIATDVLRSVKGGPNFGPTDPEPSGGGVGIDAC